MAEEARCPIALHWRVREASVGRHEVEPRRRSLPGAAVANFLPGADMGCPTLEYFRTWFFFFE